MEFVKKNIKVYLDNEWNTPQLQEDVAKLREASKKDAGPPIEETGPAGTVQESVARYVIACIDEQRGNDALFKFRFHMWFYGYDKNKLVTAVYTDVADSLAKWHAERIKVYVCSNSWKEVSKRFLAQTVHGNLTTFVDDYFDSSDGPLTKSETFNKIAERIQIKPPEIVFLTKSGDEARAALAAGWVAVLVLTHQREIDRMKEEDKKLMMIRTFTDLQFGENPPPVSAAAASASSSTNKAESGGAGASGSAKSKVKSAGPRASQASSASKQKSMTVKSTSRKSAKEKSASLKSKKGGSLASSKASRNTSAAKSGSSKTKKSSRKSASSAASKSGQSSNAASASKSGSSAASSGASGSGASGTASGSSGTSSTNSFGSNAVASNPSGSTASGSGSNSASSGSSASGSSGASGTSDSAASGSGASSGSSGSSNTSGSGASGSASGSSSSK